MKKTRHFVDKTLLSINLKAVICEAFADDHTNIKAYMDYRIIYDSRVLESQAGEYKCDGTIVLYECGTTYPMFIFITALHEAAHHIQYVRSGVSNHGQEFYQIFEKLIYMALDKRFLSEEDIQLNAEYRNTADKNKIVKMLTNYKPDELIASSDVDKIIHVKHTARYENLLKRRWYTYNPLEYTWDYICSSEDKFNREKEFLLSIMESKDFLIGDIPWEPASYIEVVGNLKGAYNELAGLGFELLRRKKEWYCSLEISEISNADKVIRYLDDLSEDFNIHYKTINTLRRAWK